MSSSRVLIYKNDCINDVKSSLLSSYKHAFKACRFNNNTLNQLAILSFKKTVRSKLNELTNKNSILSFSDIKSNFDSQIFFDKTPDYISKNIKNHLLVENNTNVVKHLDKHCEPGHSILEKEIIELITDLNYLTYLVRINCKNGSKSTNIRNLILEKNKRNNIFSSALEDDEIKKRIKIQIDIATEFKDKIPLSFKKNFDAFLSYIKMKYNALESDLLEDNPDMFNSSLYIPNKLESKLSKICKPYYIPQMTPLERHKHAIKHLNRIIVRIKTGPKVRIVNFKTAIYPISLPIANSEKNDVFDNKMNEFFTGLRYQTFLNKNYANKRLYLSDLNAINAFLQNMEDEYFDSGSRSLALPLNELYLSAYKNTDKLDDLKNNLSYIKDNLDWLTEKNEQIKNLFTKNMSTFYLDQYNKDFSNTVEMLKRYNSLDLATVNPYDPKNDLDCRLIQNELIDKIRFYNKFGTIITMFLKYIKAETIRYHRGQRE